MSRDRDDTGRAHNARRRDDLGRPLPRGADGHPPYDDPALPPADALRLAQQLLDAGRSFTAHEVLEAVWKSSPVTERELWRGLAQLMVGITHRERGNANGSRSLLDRAAASLRGYAGSAPYGVPTDALIAWARGRTGAPPRIDGS